MIRFKNTAYSILILGLLLSHISVSYSVGHSNAIPLTHEGTFVLPKWTWNRGLPAKVGDLSMDLNFTFDPMLVHVKLPGEILVNEEKRTIKVSGTGGHFRIQGGSTITGDVVMDFGLPSPPLFFSGIEQDIYITRKMPISYVTYPYGNSDGKWNRKVVLNNFFLRSTRTGNASLFFPEIGPDVFTSFTYSSGRPVLTVRAETPGYVGTGAWDTDIASNIAVLFPEPFLKGSDAQSAKILANHFMDYFDVNMYFGLRIWSEYTFACETLTVNGTAITDADQAFPAPDFDPTEETYQIESSYDEDFTYGLNLIVEPGSVSAKFVVLKDIELWSYEAQVPEKHVSILPKKRYDIDFTDISTKATIFPLYFPNEGLATGLSPYIIPDPSLSRAIEEELGWHPGDPRDLTRADLRQLTHLSARVSSSNGLDGLQHAVNLRSLAVRGNFSDLSPLSKLKKLESLNVSTSALSEVSLSKLPNLKTLYIDRTPLLKVTLSDLVSLTELRLPVGSLSELSLSKLPNLQTLNVGHNPLSDVSVSNLGSLTELEFVNHTLSELSLSNLKNLVKLNLEGSTISKLSLSNLPNLREMHQERHIGGWGPLPYEQPLDMNLSHLGISELSLSKLPHLKELDISNNHISDLSLLKGTEKLTHLNLSGNAISLIFPYIAGDSHTRLIWLNLSNNLLTSGGMSAGVLLYPNLRVLDLSHNNISRLPHRFGLNTKLTHLNLANNQLSSLTLTRLPPRFRSLTHLKLDNNQLSEVSLSGTPKNLELMSLANNPLSKVSLSDLPKLIHVDIYGTTASTHISSPLSEVSLSRLTNVRGFGLSGHPFLSKVSVSELPNLEDLNMFRNPLLSEVSLSGIPNLKYLRFAWNKNLSTLSLPELPNLTTLRCFDNSLSDVSFVKELTNLTELELSDNLISDVAPLSNLINLTELRLNNNLISDIAPLSNLINLTKLKLNNNLISDVAPLSNLTSLTELELSNNYVSDVAPLSNLTNLTVRAFYNNPVHPDSLRAYRKEIGMVFSPPSELPVLIKISGDGQIGAPGEKLPEPFVVQALDENERPVIGASIRFYVYEGEGTLTTPVHTLIGGTDITATGVDGKTETTLTLGPNPGSNRVAAIGYDGFKAIFTATATLDVVTSPQIAEDVNGDGVVNIQDLVFVTSNFGQTGEHAADVNGDGIVDIRDLVQVAGVLQ